MAGSRLSRRACLRLLAAGAGAGARALKGGVDGILLLTAVDPSMPESEAIRAGLAFGAGEASRLAVLLQRTCRVATTDHHPESLRTALARGHGGTAYITALPAAGLQALVGHGLRSPVVAIVDGDPGASHPHLFTIAMAGDGTKVAAADGCEHGRLQAWHPTLVRYGAGELNERFERHTGRQMSSGAWAAWAAIKIAMEAALRADSPAPGIAAALRRLTFDAHKGRALSFDETQRLVQPMYHVASCRGTPRVMEVEP